MADQLGLRLEDPLGLDAMGPPVAGVVDTSRAAAWGAIGRVAKDRRRILLYVVTCGARGATQDDVSATLVMHHGTASARFKELRDAGYIERTADRRPTRTGATARIHVATARGKEALRASSAAQMEAR